MAGCASREQSALEGRIERCIDRFLERAAETGGSGADEADLREYVRRGYCERFDSLGWVHGDGSLAIAAFTEGGREECATGTAGGGSVTVPCASFAPAGPRVDCALLHLVRRSEVRAFVASLEQPSRCDDGTPLDELGAR